MNCDDFLFGHHVECMQYPFNLEKIGSLSLGIAKASLSTVHKS
jgi:hypothetical protein